MPHRPSPASGPASTPAASPAAGARSGAAAPALTVPAEQVFPILQSNILVDGFHIVIDLEKSHGSFMVDARDGKEYLDCYAHFASLPVGHNHPGLAEPEFQRTLLRAATNNPANSDVYTREYAAFVQTFRRVAVPEAFRYLFFIAGGSAAVENAMKTAFDWKTQLNRARGVQTPGDKILHFREGFHGRGGYTLSVTNTDLIKVADFPKFDWPRVSNPKLRFLRPAGGPSGAGRAAAEPLYDVAAVGAAEDQSVREIEAAFAKDPHGIAAILIEPIQGEGGDNHFRGEFLARLRTLADRHDALLIFDEIQTGIGGTGSMWCWQQLGVQPDLVVFGKKMQVCGLMSTARVDSVPNNVFHKSSRINSTWGGNLVDMVRANRYLQIIESEGLVENAARVGALFLDGLHALARRYPQLDNVRGRGLMLAVDLPDPAARNALRAACWEAGLATLACGTRTLRFRPALSFSAADTARALEILDGVLRG